MKNKNNFEKAQELISGLSEIQSELGKLKTEKGDAYNRSLHLLSDFVEASACDMFNLKLNSQGTRGYDAISGDDKRYEIKHTTLITDKDGKEKPVAFINNLKFDAFDVLIIVFLNATYKIVEVYEIPRQHLEKEEFLGITKNGRKGFLRDNEPNGRKTLKLTYIVLEKLRSSTYGKYRANGDNKIC